MSEIDNPGVDFAKITLEQLQTELSRGFELDGKLHGLITSGQIRENIQKILHLQEEIGLNRQRIVKLENIYNALKTI